MFMKRKPTLVWCPLQEEVSVPTKRDNDAGYDIYAKLDKPILLYPHSVYLFSTGLATKIPDGYWMCVKERSSTGLLNLSVRSGVIDSNYLGEWKIIISNLSGHVCYVFNKKYKHGKKLTKEELNSLFPDISNFDTYFIYISYNIAEKAIAQAVLMILPVVETKILSKEEFALIRTDRGNGWNGSSGK